MSKASRALLRSKPTPLPKSSNLSRVGDLMEGDDTDPLGNLVDEVLEGRSERTTDGVSAQAAKEVVVATTSMQAVGLTANDLLPKKTYELPLSMLRETSLNARHHYIIEEVDALALEIMRKGQLVAASGFVEDGVVKLLDGGKRLRALRVANIDTMRVEIRERPESPQDAYILSRTFNLARSEQTCFDDAVRFKQLLEDRVFKSQAEIAEKVFEDKKKEWKVSRILSLNKIPQVLVRAMREDLPDGKKPKTLMESFAEVVADSFTEGEEIDDTKLQKITEVVHQVNAKELSLKEMKALLASRLSDPKQREKSEAVPVTYGAVTGTIKAYRARGQVEFSIKGIPEGDVEKVMEAIKRALSDATGEGQGEAPSMKG